MIIFSFHVSGTRIPIQLQRNPSTICLIKLFVLQVCVKKTWGRYRSLMDLYYMSSSNVVFVCDTGRMFHTQNKPLVPEWPCIIEVSYIYPPTIPWIPLHFVSGPWTSIVAALDGGRSNIAVCRRHSMVKKTSHATVALRCKFKGWVKRKNLLVVLR